MKENMTYDILDEMTERYITDNTDHEAVRILTEAARESEEYRIYIQNRLEVSFSSAVASSAEVFDKDKAYERFLAQTGYRTAAQSRRRKAFRWTAVAAAIAATVAMSWAGYRFATKGNEKELANICIATPNGSRTMVSMPDGSRIWLNAGSEITYSKGFGDTDRNVTLSGEACFDVAKDKELPFVVSTKSATLKVLGTKFTFRAYPEDRELTIELIRGHVDIESRKTGKHIDMKPNEKAVIDSRTGQMAKRNIDASRSDSWTKGELFFDEMPLRQIAHSLERAYGVRIKVSDSIAGKHFYGTFSSAGTSIDEVLKTMSGTRQMSYRRTAPGEYYIY